MRTNHRIAAVLFLALPLFSCQPPREQRAEFFVFGTLVEIVLRGVDENSASAAFADVQRHLQAMHNELHAWKPGALTQLNQAFAEGRSMNLDNDIPTLIEMSRTMEDATDGMFNAATGGLVRAWGFHTSEYPVKTPPPSKDEIRRILSTKPSTMSIHQEGNVLTSTDPTVQLDFGGIAKGFATDRIISVLVHEHGISEALVNAGGDLFALGGSDEHPWLVGINGPEGVIGGLEIQTGAVFTSGSSERYLEQEDSRYPHIIDPRTGEPVTGLMSVTVIDDRRFRSKGWFADAAATALMVAGPESWRELAEKLELESVLVVNSYGEVLMTAGMEKRLLPAP